MGECLRPQQLEGARTVDVPELLTICPGTNKNWVRTVGATMTWPSGRARLEELLRQLRLAQLDLDLQMGDRVLSASLIEDHRAGCRRRA